MKHRDRRFRGLQWAALTAALLMVGAIVANYWRMVYYVGPPQGHGISFTFSSFGGAVRFGWDFTYVPRHEDTFGPPKFPGKWTIAPNQTGLRDFQANARPRLVRDAASGRLTTGGYILIPLWLPLCALLAVAGAIQIHNRRPAPPGHCPRCRYNLTANTTGICPECGMAIRADHSTSAVTHKPTRPFA